MRAVDAAVAQGAPRLPHRPEPVRRMYLACALLRLTCQDRCHGYMARTASSRKNGLVRPGRHRPADRIRADPPAARDLELPAPGHSHHPAGRRRSLRRLRPAHLAHRQHRGIGPDPPVRPPSAIGSLLLGMAGQARPTACRGRHVLMQILGPWTNRSGWADVKFGDVSAQIIQFGIGQDLSWPGPVAHAAGSATGVAALAAGRGLGRFVPAKRGGPGRLRSAVLGIVVISWVARRQRCGGVGGLAVHVRAVFSGTRVTWIPNPDGTWK